MRTTYIQQYALVPHSYTLATRFGRLLKKGNAAGIEMISLKTRSARGLGYWRTEEVLVK